jgi:hypothetical protein
MGGHRRICIQGFAYTVRGTTSCLTQLRQTSPRECSPKKRGGRPQAGVLPEDTSDAPQVEPASALAVEQGPPEAWSTADILQWLRETDKAEAFARDGRPPISADLERVADRVHEAHLRNEVQKSSGQALRVSTLVFAWLATDVGLSIAVAGVWGLATPWTLALVVLQVLVLGLVAGWLGSQGWGKRLGEGVESVKSVITIVRYFLPMSWWVFPEVVGVVLAAGVFMLGVPLHHPPVVVFLLTCVPLAFCATVFSPLVSLPFVALFSAGVRAFRYTPDPVDRLIELLFQWAVGGYRLGLGKRVQWADPQLRGRHKWGQEPRDIREIEAVARVLETDFASFHVPWGSGAAAWAAAEEHGQRIAAWVRRREDDLLMSVPGVSRAMALGLLAICDRRWCDIEAEPPLTRPRRFAVRMLPRLVLAGAVGAAAVFLPDALGLKGAAHGTLTVSLAVVAVNALITPSSAISNALEKMGTALGGAK